MAFPKFQCLHYVAHILIIDFSRDGFEFTKLGDAQKFPGRLRHCVILVFKFGKAFNLSEFV